MAGVIFLTIFVYTMWLQIRNNKVYFFCIKNKDNDFLPSYNRMLFSFMPLKYFLKKSQNGLKGLSAWVDEYNLSDFRKRAQDFENEGKN